MEATVIVRFRQALSAHAHLLLFMAATSTSLAACAGGRMSSIPTTAAPQTAVTPNAISLDSASPIPGALNSVTETPPIADVQCPQVKGVAAELISPTTSHRGIRLSCDPGDGSDTYGQPLDSEDTLAPDTVITDPGSDPGPVVDTSTGTWPTPPVAPFNNPPGAPITWIFFPYVLAEPDFVYETPPGFVPSQSPFSAITDISVAIVGVDTPIIGAQIYTAGHMYVSIWSHGQTLGRGYQGGPDGARAGQNCTSIYFLGCLGPVDYSADDRPLTDYHVFLTPIAPSVAAACLVKSSVAYGLNWQKWPSYNPFVMNSNSYVDGLLLSCGYSQAYLNGVEFNMILHAFLDPYGANDGQQITSLF